MNLLQFDLRVMVSEPKLMAKISKLMWDTYVNEPEYLPFGQFSWPKPKAELICGVPYTGIQRPFKIFFVQVGHETTEQYASGGNYHFNFYCQTYQNYQQHSDALSFYKGQLISKSPFGVFKSFMISALASKKRSNQKSSVRESK